MMGCGLVGDEGLHFLGNGCHSLQVSDPQIFFLFLIYLLYTLNQFILISF